MKDIIKSILYFSKAFCSYIYNYTILTFLKTTAWEVPSFSFSYLPVYISRHNNIACIHSDLDIVIIIYNDCFVDNSLTQIS